MYLARQAQIGEQLINDTFSAHFAYYGTAAQITKSRGIPFTLEDGADGAKQLEKMRNAMLGSDIILTPGPKGMPGAIAKAGQLMEEYGDRAFMPQQFDNPANPEIHRKTTAEEVWADTEGNIDAFVAGVGTGGTITGVSEVIKQRNPNLLSVVVEPEESPVITQTLADEEVQPGPHKIQGIGAGFVPNNLNLEIVDEVERVNSDDSFAMARRIGLEEGILVGISTGATVTAALRVAKRPEMEGKRIVVVGASCGERYLTTPLAAEAAAEMMDAVAEES